MLVITATNPNARGDDVLLAGLLTRGFDGLRLNINRLRTQSLCGFAAQTGRRTARSDRASNNNGVSRLKRSRLGRDNVERLAISSVEHDQTVANHIANF